MRSSVLLLIAGVIAWGNVGQPTPPSPRYSEVYVAGEGSYHTFRIPSVIATAKGTLLAFAEARRAGAGDAGDIDLTQVGRFREATPDRGLIEPPAQASLVRLTSSRMADRDRLLFANPASTRRERLTVRLSYDEGATWPVSRVVHDGPAAYSSLVVLRDLSIGLLFERGERSPYERISFAHLTLEWLTDGADRPRNRRHHLF
jgi:hypothetical protein